MNPAISQSIPSPYLTEAEAAAYLTFSARTLRTLRSRGTGPRFVKLGRKVLYRAEDLDGYVRENGLLKTKTHDVGVRVSDINRFTDDRRKADAVTTKGE